MGKLSTLIVKRIFRADGSKKSYNFNETNLTKKIYRVFEDDTLFDVRRKIALATGVPIYAQHITSVDNLQLYELKAEGYPHEINAHELFAEERWIQTEMGLPYDPILYENRRNLRVECFDHEKIVQILPTRELEVIDAREFLEPHRGMIRENIAYFEMIYYGFVVKYWPIMSIEVFRDFINNGEEYIEEKYINLGVDEDFVKRQTKTIEQIETVKSPVELNMLIQSATITMSSVISPLNLENLFDTFETSRDYPMIMMGETSKEWIESATQLSIRPPSQLKKGVVICCVLPDTGEQLFVSFEELVVNVRIDLETRRITSFKQHIEILTKYVNPLIERVNRKIEYISANEIPPLSTHNVKYTMMTLNLFWRKMLNATQYEDLREHIEEYFNANIFRYYQRMNFETTANLIFYFLRGGEANSKKFAVRVPENINYYSFLTDETLAETWNNTFVGTPLKMKHLFADVAFEITNIREINFIILQNYIKRILALARIKKAEPSRGGPVKRLRKLQEYDPILYNLRDGNIANENKLYSIICQGPNQPVIYSKDEVARMEPRRKKKLVEYWNFTYEEPAFYECPDSQFPNFMFMTGYHPRGYCLPCCKKRSLDQMKKEIKFFKTCMIKHAYQPSGEEGELGDDGSGLGGPSISSKNRAYLFEFGSEPLGVDRIGNVPNMDKIIPLSDRERASNLIYAAVGVKQVGAMTRKYGIISSLAYLLDVPTGRFSLENDDIQKLCIEVLREFRVQPIIIAIEGARVRFRYDARFNSNRVCYILEKPTAYEPIVLLNVIRFSQELEAERKIWNSRPRLLPRLTVAENIISVSNSMIGTVKGKTFIPASEVAFDDDTEITPLTKLIEEGRTPPTEVSSRIKMARIKHVYNKKVWGYDQYVWTSRPDIPLHPRFGRTYNWKYPPLLVLRAIDEMKPAPADPRLVQLSRATYKILFYDMLIMELVKYFTLNKNTSERQRIITCVKQKNWSHLRSIVGVDDLSTIIKQINLVGANVAEFTKLVEKTLYNFDRQIYYELISLDKVNLRARLTAIVDEITEVSSNSPPTPFKYKNNMITFRPIRLVVWPQIVGELKRYIDMLVDDLLNPIKTHMFTINLQLRRVAAPPTPPSLRTGERLVRRRPEEIALEEELE